MHRVILFYSHIKVRISDTEEEVTAFLAYDSAVDENGVMVGDKERFLIFCTNDGLKDLLIFKKWAAGMIICAILSFCFDLR